MNSRISWPALLGVAIQTKTRLLELEPQSHWATLPRVKNPEEELRSFEAERQEGVPASYREFLLHADGWESLYFGVGVFGLLELRGGGNGAPAADLLRSYESEGFLEDSEIQASDVHPIAAGQGNHLVVIIRRGDRAGRVIWFNDGEEVGAFDDFRGFFEDIVGLLQARIEQLESRT